MSRRAAAILIAAIVIAAAGVLLLARRANRPAPAPAPTTAQPVPLASPSAASSTTTWTATLYFPGADGRLHPEPRRVESAADPVARVRALVGELLAGPRTGALVRPLPEGTALGAVLVTTDKVAYVDLRGAAGAGPPPSGSTQETATVYSLVDSVALNVPEAERVALLWNGVQPESFAGHLDLTHPLAADRSLAAGN